MVTSIRPALAHPVFWLLALSFVSYAFMFTSLIFNLVPMLRESGYTTGEAVAAYACIGPAQLAGRVAVLTLERFISLTVAGLIGTLFPVVAVIILMTLQPHSPLVIVFAVSFGTGMGIKTIVQATAAPEFLGRAGYGALQGALMFPVYLAQAVSPLLAAWIWQLDGQYDLLRSCCWRWPASRRPPSCWPPDCDRAGSLRYPSACRSHDTVDDRWRESTGPVAQPQPPLLWR